MSKQPSHAKALKMPQWATECPTRTPKFKVHNQIGHAKNAVNARLGNWTHFYQPDWEAYGPKRAIIDVYELVDGQWVHHPEMSIGPETHEFVAYVSPYTNRGSWKLRRKDEQ